METKHKKFAESLRNILCNNKTEKRRAKNNMLEENFDLQAELECKFNKLSALIDKN